MDLSDSFEINRLKKSNPESYFQEILEVEEYGELQTLVVDSCGAISWDKLIEDGVVKIEGKKVEGIYWKGDLNLRCTKIKTLGKIKKIGGGLYCNNLYFLKDLGELEEVSTDIDLIGTELKTLGKLKKIGRTLSCNNMGKLENLGELTEVGEDFDLRGTKVESLGKLKVVGGILACGRIIKLEDLGELEEIGGNLDMRGTNIKFQKGIFQKINEKRLEIKKEIYFGGDKGMIEELLKIKGIKGVLNIEELNWKEQVKYLRIIEKKGLNIKVDGAGEEIKLIEGIYKKRGLDIEEYIKKFGKQIDSIKDKKVKELAIYILQEEYRERREKIEGRIKIIIKENERKELAEEEKKQLREQIMKLDRDLKEVKIIFQKLGLSINIEEK